MNRGTQIGTVLVALLVVAASSVAVMATPATLGATTDERIASNGNTADVQATNGSDNVMASVTFTNQTTNGSTVIVESVTVPEGGFVTIHTTSLLPPANETVGSVVGVSSYLAPGTHENVTVPLFERYGAEVPSDPARPDDRVGRLTENRTLIAMPHRDTNGNQVYEFVRSDGGTDGPYLNNSTAVTDDAAITVPQSSRPNATVAFDDQATDGATITIDSVTTTDGGFVAIHNASLLSGNIVGSVIGTTEYLEPGSHENVTVELFEVPGANFSRTQLRENATLIAMPHLDTNENQVYDFVRTDAELDGPYTANETTVIDRANVTDEDGAADGAAEPDDADARNDTVYYQVDFVVGEPIENFDTGGTYANDRLLRFVHGSTDDPVMRRAPGVLAYADAPELNERIESRDITVENGTATITFSIDDGESVRLSLVSYEKVGPGWSPATEDEQEFIDAETRTFESGTHTLTVELPGREAADETDAPDERADDADNATTLTVLSYNDIQTAAAKNESLPRLVELVAERRQAHENPTVVVGGGDEVGPHALGPISQWRPPVAVLNHLDPTAEVIGNHEFDYGLAAVSNFTAASEFPWLATNLVNSSTGEAFDGTERYEIVEKDGITVGIIGLVDQGATYGKTNINFSERGLTVRNYTQVGARTATMLEEERNVDVVIALAHTGISEAKTLARADDGDIDTIVVGDDERYYPPQETSGTVITEARARAQFLGELNLTVEGGEVTGWEGRLLNVTNATQKNDTASSIIAEYRGVELPGTNVSFDEVIVRSKTPLDARFGSNYHHETGYGDLITDAMRAEADADVAITNAGGIRSDTVYGPGNITAGDVYNTLPFGNTLVTVELTGAELKRTLESQVVTLESETGSQLGAEISQQVSGVSFEWVAHTGTEEKIRDVTVNGEPLDPNATYEVAVNSFIADGGSGYPLADAPRVSETDTPIATIVIEYLEERDVIAPAPEGRMRRVDAALGNASIELDGEGTVEVAVDAPSDLTGVVPGTYVLSAGVNRTVTPDGGVYDRDTVAADSAVYDEANGTVVVTFDDAALADLVRTENTTDLDLYGSYNSSAYDRVYFNASRLNVNVNATTVEEQSSQQRIARRPANAGPTTNRLAEA